MVINLLKAVKLLKKETPAEEEIDRFSIYSDVAAWLIMVPNYLIVEVNSSKIRIDLLVGFREKGRNPKGRVIS